jgi:ABC-type transporter Mla MlaB component
MSTIKDIQCGDQLTIAQVSELYAQLLSALVAGQAVNINISEINRVDTAALQLLYTFHLSAQKNSLVVIWSAASESVVAAANTLGMGAFYQQND